MESLNNKKLLFLGGGMFDYYAVLKAKELGIYTVVANFYPAEHSPAKFIADKSYSINNTDTEAMLKLIRDEKIDGIFGGFTDSNLPNYYRLCTLAGLPCYGTKEQFDKTIDKAKFKAMCRKYGVPTVKEYQLKDIAADKPVEYPLFIKPIDNSGSRGCSSCYNYEEYCKSVEYALSYSPSKTVTVEKFYDFRNYSDFHVCYSIRNGVVTLASMADRLLFQIKKNISPLPIHLSYPSQHLDAFIHKVHPQIKHMLEEERFMNGSIFFQGFTDGEQFWLFEMGFRQNGSLHFVLTDYFHHNNTLIEGIQYALTGELDVSASERDDPHFDKPARHFIIHLKPGRVNKIYGVEDALQVPGVINYTPLILEGLEVGPQGTLGQSFGRFHIVGKTFEELDKIERTVRNMIHVTDIEGNSMVVDVNPFL